MEIKLKPCPFCEGEARIEHSLDFKQTWCVCEECWTTTSRYGHSTDTEAITAWNRRAGDKTRTQYQIVLPIKMANEKEFDHIRSWLAYTDAACAMLITLIEGAEKELKRYRAEG